MLHVNIYSPADITNDALLSAANRPYEQSYMIRSRSSKVDVLAAIHNWVESFPAACRVPPEDIQTKILYSATVADQEGQVQRLQPAWEIKAEPEHVPAAGVSSFWDPEGAEY